MHWASKLLTVEAMPGEHAHLRAGGHIVKLRGEGLCSRAAYLLGGLEGENECAASVSGCGDPLAI